ncbi:MAG: 4-hydroxy-tetrahydrodipicolinate reductase [Candidatus Eisenbacteria bacterium]|nr:4-hydroxy-tetrahydrodipicolinate reductase [Candidatus Eisenbacteria bacterium]
MNSSDPSPEAARAGEPSVGTEIPVAISGACGRLGRRIVACLSSEPGPRPHAALESPGSDWIGSRHPECPSLTVIDEIDVALDGSRALVEASLPLPAMDHAEVAAEAGVPLLMAVTGLSQAQRDRLDQLSVKIPVLVTSNLSMGVSALVHLCREAARGLGFDVEIVEMHHKGKRDAPSGTALMLARAIAEARGWGEDSFLYGREGAVGQRPEKQIGIHAVRGGEIVGEHQVVFAGQGERLVLSHSAESRDCFARGVAPAIRFLCAQGPGRYGMDDVWRAALKGS